MKPDGFSRPYILAMALATAFYGFLGVFLSFRFACQFVEERWALLATVGIWLATSLPVYMYFNPSWSHAHSVFIVAVFLWYWYRTRQARTTTQWVILGLISGLVLDVYYVNVAVLVVPLLESLEGYWRSVARQPVDVTRGRTEPFPAPPQRPPHVDWPAVGRLFRANLLYCCAALAAFLPTLITRKIIYGGPFIFGYREAGGFRWSSPYLRSALLSADHGLLAWTPILILAAGGLFLFLKRDRRLAAFLIVALVTFCYIVGGDPNWDGIASFGNRFFVSLTPLFVLGLAVLFNELARWLKSRRTALVLATSVIALFILWNFAFIFQWGTHMVPARGPISWKQMVRNQFLVVPRRATTDFKAYLQNRRALMQEIEEEDVIQLTPGGGQNHQSTNDRTQGDDRNDRGPRR